MNINNTISPNEPSVNNGCAPSTCSVVLWVHTHFDTKEPIQIEPKEWHGSLDPFDYIVDKKNINDIKINVPHEQWVSSRIEWYLDDGYICGVTISGKTTPTTNYEQRLVRHFRRAKTKSSIMLSEIVMASRVMLMIVVLIRYYEFFK